jgi:hypothetical protein
VLTPLTVRAQKKGLNNASTLRTTWNTDLIGDAMRLRQILLIFADNALPSVQIPFKPSVYLAAPSRSNQDSGASRWRRIYQKPHDPRKVIHPAAQLCWWRPGLCSAK